MSPVPKIPNETRSFAADSRHVLSVSHVDVQANHVAQQGRFGRLNQNLTTRWKTLDQIGDQAGLDTGVTA